MTATSQSLPISSSSPSSFSSGLMASMTNMVTNNIPESALYFTAGALLPTLAWIFLGRSSSSSSPSHDDGHIRSTDDFQDAEDGDEDMEGISEVGPSSQWGVRQAPYKMVLCVNTSLGMGKGKIAAQCSHAAVGCYKRASKQCPGGLRAWERTGCAKIALKCPTDAELEELCLKGMSLDIPVYLVEDAGRTQIAAGSRTVLGLGPAPVQLFEGITTHLKLM